jgi:hypothetical protein
MPTRSVTQCFRPLQRHLTHAIPSQQGHRTLQRLLKKIISGHVDITVLAIDHRHGTDITIHASERQAQHALANYCKQYWSDFCFADRMPPNPTKLVRHYFQESDGHESYQITSSTMPFRSCQVRATD